MKFPKNTWIHLHFMKGHIISAHSKNFFMIFSRNITLKFEIVSWAEIIQLYYFSVRKSKFKYFGILKWGTFIKPFEYFKSGLWYQKTWSVNLNISMNLLDIGNIAIYMIGMISYNLSTTIWQLNAIFACKREKQNWSNTFLSKNTST